MKQLRKKYHLPYSSNLYKTYYRNVYNSYDGRSHTVYSDTFNIFTNTNHVKHQTKHSPTYYTFISVYLVRPKHSKRPYWNYESHAIDAKTGKMYRLIRIGSAGGKG